MKSWLDIEGRFRSLAPALRHMRLDYQWGAAGEYWSLTGGQQSVATREFETLCALAGKNLSTVLRGNSELEAQLLAEADDTVRWYRCLVKLSGRFSAELPARQLDDEGNFAGHLFFGSLHDLASNAGNVCLQLQATHPLPEKSRAQKIWDDYGSKLFIGVLLLLAGAIIKIWLG